MNRIEIVSALLVSIAAIYWLLNPDQHIEPIIVIIPALLMVAGSLISRNWKRPQGLEQRGAVTVDVTNRKIRCYKACVDYALQLDIELFFRSKVVLKGVQLTYKEHYGFGEKISQRAELYQVYKLDEDLLTLSLDEIRRKLHNAEPIPKLPLSFDETSLLKMTIAGYVPGERLPDGWEGLTLGNWTLSIRYNQGEVVEVPVVFEAHPETLQIPVAYKNEGFISA